MDRLSVADEACGKTRILSERCSTCILRPPGERIGLTNERLRQFVHAAVEDDSYVVCHSTLSSVAPAGVRPAVCRGFADTYDTVSLRLIRTLWGFVEVEPPDRMCPDPAGHAALHSSHEVTGWAAAEGRPIRVEEGVCAYCGKRLP